MSDVVTPPEVMESKSELKPIIDNIKQVFDPEIGVDIWTLELIYDIQIKDGVADVIMTFTSPLCPFGPELVASVEKAVKDAGFEKVNVEVSIDPPWAPSDRVKELLGMPI